MGFYKLFIPIAAFILSNCQMERQKNEENRIIELRKEYTNAWLANDSEKILATLTKDAVLIPHHGDQPISGINSIIDFWWPENQPPSVVTLFESTYDDIEYGSKLGYIRGRFKLGFQYENKNYYNEGNYLNIVKMVNGRWKLYRLIWNDPITEETN